MEKLGLAPSSEPVNRSIQLFTFFTSFVVFHFGFLSQQVLKSPKHLFPSGLNLCWPHCMLQL
jgi:hypothetical protein